jgi:hypothetical protein
MTNDKEQPIRSRIRAAWSALTPHEQRAVAVVAVLFLLGLTIRLFLNTG